MNAETQRRRGRPRGDQRRWIVRIGSFFSAFSSSASLRLCVQFSFFLTIGLLFPQPAAAATSPASRDAKPNFDDLARRGTETVRKLQTGVAEWTTRITLGDNAILFDTLRSAEHQRYVLSVAINGKPLRELTRIIARDGFWYVTDIGKSAKYRPYEAALQSPQFYLSLSRSALQAVSPEDHSRMNRFESIDGDVATYRSPIVEQLRPVLQQMIDQFDAMVKATPDAVDAKTRKQIDAARELLDKGLLLRVSVSTGIVLETSNPQVDVRTENFRFLDSEPAGEFDVAGKSWSDETDDLAHGHPDDLALFMHASLMSGGSALDGDPILLNVSTGRYRRVPFRGPSATVGGFTADRKSVIVCAAAHGEPARPWSIHLQTGENEPLGGEGLSRSRSIVAAPIPGGRKIAVLTRGRNATTHAPESQVWLLDVSTSTATPLGDPIDATSMSPLPDGSGVLVVRRDNPDAEGATAATSQTLCRLDLSGNLTPILNADAGCALSDAATLLFHDPVAHRWSLCDMQGHNVRAFRSGEPESIAAALSPDGKRVLMIRNKPGAAPLWLVPVDAKSPETPLSIPAGGAWAMPVWR